MHLFISVCYRVVKLCFFGKQRGTNELKKYLRSRIEPAEPVQPAPTPVFRPAEGTSGIIGGTGDGVDRFRLSSTKTLEYWSVIAWLFLNSAWLCQLAYTYC